MLFLVLFLRPSRQNKLKRWEPRLSVTFFSSDGKVCIWRGSLEVVFSPISLVAVVHGIRAAMQPLKKAGTDFTSAA
jgi:hypothetical protein